MPGYDHPQLAEINAAVTEWTQINDPLTRNEFTTLQSRFLRTIGDPTRVEIEGDTRLKNTHMRQAPAHEFGVFAFEEDPVLIELDDETEYGEMLGFPVDGGWVPVLVCLAGPPEKAKNRMESLVSALQTTADGELAL